MLFFSSLTLSRVQLRFQILLASEHSERDTYRGNTIENRGCLLASERSERDTYRGKNEKIGDVCLYICLDVRMSFCTLTLAFLC